MATRPSVISPAMRRYIIWLILALLAMVILYDCARRARERQAIEATSVAQRDYAEILDEGRLRLLVGYDAFGDGALDSASRADSRGEEGGWVFRLSRLVAPQGIMLETLLEDNAQRALDELRRGGGGHHRPAYAPHHAGRHPSLSLGRGTYLGAPIPRTATRQPNPH